MQGQSEDVDRSGWRILLLSLEVALICSWIGLVVIRWSSDRRIHSHEFAEDVCGAVFVVSMVALFLGSPWLVKSVRVLALAGWCLGFLAFIWCLLMPVE